MESRITVGIVDYTPGSIILNDHGELTLSELEITIEDGGTHAVEGGGYIPASGPAESGLLVLYTADFRDIINYPTKLYGAYPLPY